ncbi:nuclear transport factor 2 family protein [Desulfatibacillum aliphaticivorans]|uniref:nuclear transport factor 2 family protein n=1 Tax=Desulfatibacillum aliphaticivorans TaxID=218208 RepID=UPI00040939C9|nr:nuclear transport factor 2 family protein [Desulfatibacillum aliphaticivorans]
MEQSAELKDLYVKICEAQAIGDYAFFQEMFSQEEGALAIGTDPSEWWIGYEAITKVFQAQLEEIGGFTILPGESHACCNDSAGWIAGNPAIKMADGTEFPMRLTVVLEKAQGGWKIIQWHSSVGVSNEDLIGETLTT